MCEKSSSLEVLRHDVFARIQEERRYQDTLNNEVLSVGEELELLQNYMRTAQDAYGDTFGDTHEEPTMHELRKIAAIALRCMEHHGAPERNER